MKKFSAFALTVVFALSMGHGALARSSLTGKQMDKVTAGKASASFTFSNTASGTIATITGNITQSTTATSASQSGSFSSSSE